MDFSPEKMDGIKDVSHIEPGDTFTLYPGEIAKDESKIWANSIFKHAEKIHCVLIIHADTTISYTGKSSPMFLKHAMITFTFVPDQDFFYGKP